jgi:5,10-methylenetetrahydromethanopterin reductase
VTSETTQIRTGVWLFPDRRADELVNLIKTAENLGVNEMWLGDEGPAREPFSVLAAAAQATSKILLCVGVTNPFVRTPALTVTTALTVHELSGGRCVLGVGAGGQLSLGPFNLTATAPLSAVRNFVGTARSVMNRTTSPDYSPTSFAVDQSVAERPMPVFIGARGPRLNALASATADGAFVAGMPPFRYESVISAARSVKDIDIALYPAVALSEEHLERQRPQMIWGLSDTPEAVRQRFDLDADRVAHAAHNLSNGDDAAARNVVTDELLEEVIVYGNPQQIAERLVGLVRKHQPASIGMALTEHRGMADVIAAAEVFDEMRSQLGETP